jgi:trimethylamine--corrinoid protein Co-methyltransferase
MTTTAKVTQPTLRFLSEKDIETIYTAALTVLERHGMQVQHPRAAELLKSAGAAINADDRISIPASMVERSLKSAPNRIAIYNRAGDPAMDLGGRRGYYGTGSDLIYSLDGENFNRHHCRLEDVARAARVADALPNIDFIMSFAHPNDIAPERAYLVSFQAMMENSLKPIVNTADDRWDLQEMWEIGKILRGGHGELRAKPYWIQYTEPISPLKHPFKSIDKLLFCAETGMPVIYSPAPIAGSTAPITIAGHVVQGLAESLFGLVIHQLEAEGSPFLMGMGPAVLDLVTSQCSYTAPEYLMGYMAIVEISKWLDLPNWGYAGVCDSQIPDEQATLEAGLMTFMAALSGSNLNHDVGYLDFGRTGSLEMMVIMDEFIDQVRRIQRGIPVDADQLALEAIGEGAREGQFLTLTHTFDHMRSTQWRPKLISRKGFEQWQAEDNNSLFDRARTKLKDILANHPAPPLDETLATAIGDRVAAFKRKPS